MEIVWYGHSCFRLKTRGAIVLCDPCAKKTTSVTIPIRDVIANFKTIEDYKRDPNCNLPENP